MSLHGHPESEPRRARHVAGPVSAAARLGAGWLAVAGCLPVAVGLGLAAASPAAQADVPALAAQADMPRAYGYRLGDLVLRRVRVEVPAGLTLDPDSLPRAGQRGLPIELRDLAWEPLGDGRFELRLRYQVFQSPPETRTLELPTVRLRFTGTPREETLRIDAWPVTVSPLVPVDVSPRTGLGEFQPDEAAPLLETKATATRLTLWAGGLLAGGLYLALVYLGLPAWARRRRPFGRAWQQVSALPSTASAEQWREGARALHQALNETAGQVVFAQGLEAFLARAPQYASLQRDWREFFEASRREFFAGDEAPRDTTSLRRLCRQARDLERGAA